MDGNQLFRRLIRQLKALNKTTQDLLETASEIELRQKEGTFPPFPAKIEVRGTPELPRALVKAAKTLSQTGVPRIEIDRRTQRGGRFRVIIPGLTPLWMTKEGAALLQALAERGGETKDRFVAYKTLARLQARVEQLTHKRIQQHSLTTSISRLKRESLRYPALIQRRDSEAPGEGAAYRFVLHADGEVIEHRPDGGAIDGATAADR